MALHFPSLYQLTCIWVKDHLHKFRGENSETISHLIYEQLPFGEKLKTVECVRICASRDCPGVTLQKLQVKTAAGVECIVLQQPRHQAVRQ